MSQVELYHFHKEGTHDKLWSENNTIRVPKEFKSDTYERFINFSNTVSLSTGEKINYYEYIREFLKQPVYDPKVIYQLLAIGHDISFRSNEFKREQALENYRLKFNSTLPSRLHSIYLTDEKGIDAWKQRFGDFKVKLYRVSIDGIIFKTNEQLIPEEELSYGDCYNKAYQYWNPSFKNVPDDANEYLVQGKIKLLEKIDKF